MRGQSTKKRWDDCAKIGQALGVSKWEVNTYLYSAIKDAGLLDSVLDLDAIKKLPAWAEMEAAKKQEIDETAAKREMFGINEAASQMRLSMWFISKFESPEQALKVLTATVAAVDACKKQS